MNVASEKKTREVFAKDINYIYTCVFVNRTITVDLSKIR